MAQEYHFIAIERAKYGDGFSVYGFGTYPRSSVLAGQTMKQYLKGFDTEEEARAAFPQAEQSVQFRDPHNTFDHLPDEDDPVPGGAYPDDYGDESLGGGFRYRDYHGQGEG